MLNNFANWWAKHDVMITWWLIGWLSFALIEALTRENYVSALVDAILIVFNYKMWSTRKFD